MFYNRQNLRELVTSSIMYMTKIHEIVIEHMLEGYAKYGLLMNYPLELKG